MTGYRTKLVTTLYTEPLSTPTLAGRLKPSYSQLSGFARRNQLHG